MQQGQILADEFMLQRLLSRGPIGEVWRALELKVGRLVRLSFFPRSVLDDPSAGPACRRRRDEFQGIVHPHLVPTTRWLETADASPAFVSRFVEGPNLAEYAGQWVATEGRLPFPLLFDVLGPVASALDTLSDGNRAHGNLTSTQIIVSQTEGLQIYGAGILEEIRRALDRLAPASTSRDLSEQRYLAPEQLDGSFATGRSDLYALAVIAWELLSKNRPLFSASTAEELRTRILQADPPLLPDQPDHVNAALQRALLKNPEGRFASCRQFLEGLAGRYTAPAAAVPNRENRRIVTDLSPKTGTAKTVDDDSLYALSEPKPVEKAADPFRSDVLPKTDEAISLPGASSMKAVSLRTEVTAPSTSAGASPTVAALMFPDPDFSRAINQETIVSFDQIAREAEKASAEKVASKIDKERRFQRMFYLWNALLLLGCIIALFVFRDRLARIWRGVSPTSVQTSPDDSNRPPVASGAAHAGTIASDSDRMNTPRQRTRRTRTEKEETFEETDDSPFRNIGETDVPDEVRFLGTSASGKRILFVVDASAPMGGGDKSPWNHVQKELVFSFKDLNPTQQFQVVYFNDEPRLLPEGESPEVPWISVSPAALREAHQFLKTVEITGSGRPVEALIRAVSLRPDAVFFLTDQNCTNLTRQEIDSLKSRTRMTGRPLTISAVEIGDGPEPPGRTSPRILADAFGGEYKWIDARIHSLKR